MSETSGERTIRILVLNPNSSQSMTRGIEEAIRNSKRPKHIEFTAYTGPQGSPASINDGNDLVQSTNAVLADLSVNPMPLRDIDAILVACFSVHPLVARLLEIVGDDIIVTGIFESSILTAFSLLPPYASTNSSDLKTWGVVTTGRFWEDHLADGVRTFLGQEKTAAASHKFAGVYSTGLDAGDFHGGFPAEVIKAKLKSATIDLLNGSNVWCVVMGCAGMAGLEDIIRDAARDKYGTERGNRVYIVDGVKAGVGMLDQTIHNVHAFWNN